MVQELLLFLFVEEGELGQLGLVLKGEFVHVLAVGLGEIVELVGEGEHLLLVVLALHSELLR